MPRLIKSFNVKPRDFIRAGEASIKVKEVLKAVGFEEDVIRRSSVCAYEAEMNIVMYGGDGNISLIAGSEKITLDITDNGPGIENIEMALVEGYSTSSEEYQQMGFGAGMGLPNIKKNSDFLEINSQKGKGTHLKIGFKVNG
jgi:anti-sigma regulatory factor (Ser/Thr protein kinase)